MNKIIQKSITAALLVSLCGFAYAKNDHYDKRSKHKNDKHDHHKPGHHKHGNSQAGGLPALAEEVANLQALVASLQADVDALQGGDSSDPYSGEYHATFFETGHFGCGNATDPAPFVGTPAFLGYLQDQGISSTTVRSATVTVESDGEVLYVPEHTTFSQEIRLSGLYEQDSRIDGNFQLDIGEDGELTFNPGPHATVTGQFSQSGDAFTLLSTGLFDEEGCNDSYTLIVVGVKVSD